MDKLLNSNSGYIEDSFYESQLIEQDSTTSDFSLTDAEKKTSEIVERLNALDFPASNPDHRVRPRDEEDGNGAELREGLEKTAR